MIMMSFICSWVSGLVHHCKRNLVTWCIRSRRVAGKVAIHEAIHSPIINQNSRSGRERKHLRSGPSHRRGLGNFERVGLAGAALDPPL